MSAKTILPATVPSHSPIHHARSRTTAHLQRVKPTQDADYKRNLLQHQIGAQAEEHRLRRDMEEARLNRKRLTNLETERKPRLIERLDSFIDRCFELVDRHVIVMILGSLLVLCGRGFSQTASGSVQNADGSKTLITCTYGGCLETIRSSDYQFALGKARGKDGQKWCDKWAGPGSWSEKNLDKKPAARANVQACKDAGRIR